MIKLVASDIDGTLLQGGTGSIPTKCFELIHKLAENGIRFAAASGRQYTNLRRLFAPVADDIDYICENGNLVICHGEICYKRTIERTYGAHLMHELMAINSCEVLLSGVETCYVQPKDAEYVNHMRYFVGNDVTVVPDITDIPEDYLKISAYFKNGVPKALIPKLEQLAQPLMRPVISGLPWLDFLLEGCDKGSAMLELQKKLQVSKAETMSFGDNENDIELLQQSGVRCAMRSGNPKLHRYADYLVDDVTDFTNGYLFG